MTEAEEPTEVTEEQVAELLAETERQNHLLVNRLQMLGKAVNPMMLLKLELDTLLDFVFEDEGRAQYTAACSMRLNQMLKQTYASVVGAAVDE